jgi:hypothetical protein
LLPFTTLTAVEDEEGIRSLVDDDVTAAATWFNSCQLVSSTMHQLTALGTSPTTWLMTMVLFILDGTAPGWPGTDLILLMSTCHIHQQAGEVIRRLAWPGL